MAARKDLVQEYHEGFRQGDHARVLACLTEDVIWDLPGFRHLQGKAAFDSEIENPDFAGSPVLHVDRLVEEGDTVVAIGRGQGRHRLGGPFRFAYCTVFTFSGELIGRVESYVVSVPEA